MPTNHRISSHWTLPFPRLSSNISYSLVYLEMLRNRCFRQPDCDVLHFVLAKISHFDVLSPLLLSLFQDLNPTQNLISQRIRKSSERPRRLGRRICSHESWRVRRTRTKPKRQANASWLHQDDRVPDDIRAQGRIGSLAFDQGDRARRDDDLGGVD